MRLTLRTLLAYLDDVLAPEDTKIIGQKIQESPMAQLLVSRIREVMRRRRLKAPDVFGPEMGIDPNIVSQYLDNTLSADRYADVERVLLASDEMLAEAAACHQVLTVILADPSDVSTASRERLYALGPVDVSSQLAVSGETSIATTSRTPESIATRNGSTSSNVKSPATVWRQDETTTTVPDYLKPSPWSQRIFPSAIVALLVVICAALLAPGFMTGVQQANNEIQRKGARDKSGGPAVSDESIILTDADNRTIELASRPDDVTLPPSPSPATSIRPKLPAGIDPVPPKDDSDGTPVPAPKPGTKSRDSDSPADAQLAVRPSKGEPSLPAKPTPIPPETVAVIPITYASNDGVLVRLDEALQHWFMIPHRSAMKPGETIANIEPYEGVLDFDKGSVRASLIGETLVNLLIPGEVGTTGLSIRKGRIVIQNGRTDENRPATIGIAIGDDLWKLELMSSETVCGLEVTPRETSQFQKLQDYHWYQATLYVISGSAKWTNLTGKSQEVGDHMALNIIPEKDALVRSNPISFPSAPDWCDSAKRKAMMMRRHQYQTQFEKAFELNQPVDQSMLTLVKNSKFPKIAELAAQCLSAIESDAALVETLAECQYEEARFAARDGLRQWLPLNPDRGLKLMKELESYYPPAEADAVYQMLWGFSRDDVTNSKATSWLLINWMRSQRLEIRELADFWVERLIGRKTEFRATGTLPQRETHVRRLEDQIERNNGLIKVLQ